MWDVSPTIAALTEGSLRSRLVGFIRPPPSH